MLDWLLWILKTSSRSFRNQSFGKGSWVCAYPLDLLFLITFVLVVEVARRTVPKILQNLLIEDLCPRSSIIMVLALVHFCTRKN